MSQKDGGPAFASPQFAVPDTLSEEQILLLRSLCGMSMRQYYKAHAPKEIPNWFRPKIDYDVPSGPDISQIEHERDRKAAENWRRDPCWDLSETHPQLEWFEDQCVATWDAQNTKERLENIERSRQWPGYWADVMLAEDIEHATRQED